jgi:hypothetical protein
VGTVSFFSTRSICPTCKAGIIWVQDWVRNNGKNVGLVPLELKVEDPNSDMGKFYIMNIRRGTNARDPNQGSGNLDI